MKLIALYSSGPRMGKSTCAKRLVDNHGFLCVSFASPIRHMVAQLLRDIGLTQDQVFYYVYGEGKDDNIEEIGTSSRYLLRTLGTGWGRDMVRKDLWIIPMARNVKTTVQEIGWPIVIDDMRFPQEFAWVRTAGGITVRIHRPELEGVNAGHASDGALDGMTFDYSFMDGNLQEALRGMDIIAGENA